MRYDSIVRAWVPVAAVAVLCGCTQDFDKFLDGSASGDGGDAAATCDVASSCIASVSSCGQSCMTGYNTCVAGCSNQQCKNNCKSQQSTCNTVCVNACVSCSDAGSCAEPKCQSALP